MRRTNRVVRGCPTETWEREYQSGGKEGRTEKNGIKVSDQITHVIVGDTASLHAPLLIIRHPHENNPEHTHPTIAKPHRLNYPRYKKESTRVKLISTR